MGQYDFERYHELMQTIDVLAIKCRMGEMRHMNALYAAVKQFYLNIRAIDHKKVDDDKMFEEFDTELRQFLNAEDVNSPNYGIRYSILMDKMEEILKRMFELKQWAGLGIEVQKVMRKSKQWKRAMGI